MTLPVTADPADIIEELDTREAKHRYGCAACVHRGGNFLGRTICGRGHRPGPKGFCKRWDLDDTWHKPEALHGS